MTIKFCASCGAHSSLTQYYLSNDINITLCRQCKMQVEPIPNRPNHPDDYYKQIREEVTMCVEYLKINNGGPPRLIDVANLLNDRGIRTFHNRPFTPASAWGVLKKLGITRDDKSLEEAVTITLPISELGIEDVLHNRSNQPEPQRTG